MPQVQNQYYHKHLVIITSSLHLLLYYYHRNIIHIIKLNKNNNIFFTVEYEFLDFLNSISTHEFTTVICDYLKFRSAII